MGVDGYTPLMFYFRNVGGADLKIILEIEEQGKFALRNLQVFNSHCVISREFENGLVIVNPSLESINIDLNQVRSNGYSFQIEMTFKAYAKGFKIKEIPIVFVDRVKGKSKMSKKIVREAVTMVWKLRIQKMFGKL